MERRADALYRTLARVLWLAAGLFLALWFLHAVLLVVLIFVLAFVIAICLNAPVTWLEQKQMPRVAATAIVVFIVAAIVGLLGWLMVPRMVTQLSHLMAHLPQYIAHLQQLAARLLTRAPYLQKTVNQNATAANQMLPPLPTMLLHVGGYTMGVFEALILLVVLIGTVVYTLARPRPLLRAYLVAMPLHLRAPAYRAFIRGSQMVVEWIRAQLIIGSIEAVAAGIFLTIIGVPGGLIWAGFTFFAELVPRIGPYIMAVPPLLAALAVKPILALWVVLFYIALNETMGNLVLPLIWGKSMDLHPVSLLFAVLALGSAFGLVGALISVPITGFIKAYYDEFYGARHPLDPQQDEQIQQMLTRQSGDMPGG